MRDAKTALNPRRYDSSVLQRCLDQASKYPPHQGAKECWRRVLQWREV